MQAIRRRHRRHISRAAAVCVAAVVAIAFAAPSVAHALRAGPAGERGGPAAANSAPASTPAAQCQPSAGALAANWRDSSLPAGPVWFAYGRSQGYVHPGDTPGMSHGAHRGGGPLETGVMIVEVGYGSRAVLTAARGTRSYFRFLNGFANGARSYSLRDGVTSLTLAGCPRGTPPGDNGRVSDYYLGFVIRLGSDAPVQVNTPGSARPLQVIFTCQRQGCDT